ncbi:MAG: 4Fe-4S binding protein, partial [Magnetococcales bacterium]|nr:4Fe-4S binding protein [Magnetococcales bacterium]
GSHADHASHDAGGQKTDHAGHDAGGSHADHASHDAGGQKTDHAGHGGSHGMGHNHPGMPFSYILPILLFIPIVLIWAIWSRLPAEPHPFSIPLTRFPIIRQVVQFLNASPQPLAMIKLVTLALYLLAIFAGIWGTATAEHNFATVLVWGLWWPLVIISVFFVGSAWCAICPWETLAKLVVFRRLWRRPANEQTVQRKVPMRYRNVYPAMVLFMGLTWLELGIGVTTIPWATAGMATIMFILATLSLIFFERKAFCRYFCPVGRTIGYYSRLAPIEIRPVDDTVCGSCTTLECYNGTKEIEPCPTHLTLGRFGQNTFCISCGSCVISCPHDNVTWRLRSMASEAKTVARAHWDGSWFMLGLLAITIFHGLTMMSFWGGWVDAVKGLLGESDPPYITFTILMLLSFSLPALAFALAIWGVRILAPNAAPYRQLFSQLAFSSLPLSFAYHLAHNLDHFSREAPDLWRVLKNPLGSGTIPFTAAERHAMMQNPLIADSLLFSTQMLLMAFGFWLGVEIVRHRARGALRDGGNLEGWKLLPVYLFVAGITLFNLWLMGQDMVMRM